MQRKHSVSVVWHPQFAPSLCLPWTLSSCDANRPQQEPQVLNAAERGRPSLQCAAISPPAKQGQQHTLPQPVGLPGSQGPNCLLWHASLFPPFFKCMPKITLSPSEYHFLIFYWRSLVFWHYQNNKTIYFHHSGFFFFILFGVFFFSLKRYFIHVIERFEQKKRATDQETTWVSLPSYSPANPVKFLRAQPLPGYFQRNCSNHTRTMGKFVLLKE